MALAVRCSLPQPVQHQNIGRRGPKAPTAATLSLSSTDLAPFLEPRLLSARAVEVEAGPSPRVLPLMAQLLESQALTSKFERIAGRAACLGLATAVACELALPSAAGLFGGVTAAGGSGDLAAQVASLGAVLLCCSVSLAARTHAAPAEGHRLLEPVIASLTAQRRSQSGVSPANVDRALDYVVDSVFTPSFLREHVFAHDESKYI